MSSAGKRGEFPRHLVSKIWLSFLWRFIITSIALGLIPGAIFLAFDKVGLGAYHPKWIHFVTNMAVVLLGSYYAIRESLNVFSADLKNG